MHAAKKILYFTGRNKDSELRLYRSRSTFSAQPFGAENVLSFCAPKKFARMVRNMEHSFSITRFRNALQ